VTAHPLRQPTRLVYVIGEPGAGKTTLMDEVLAGWTRIPQAAPIPHELLTNWQGQLMGAHLGRHRPPFGGTDALSMSIQPQALAWIAGTTYPLVLAEGDRLANARFFDTVRLVGVELTVVLLDTPPAVAAQRRAARPGSQQASWVQGRITKTARLADAYAAVRLVGAGAAEDLRALCWPGGTP
jgi:ribose 1,5-bisphosphokinase PhnN